MNQEKFWLIRSSGRIIGPLSLSETSQLLAKKIVTPIDEIRSPYRPWIFIRQHEDLMALLKSELSEKEDAISDLTKDFENTQTMTVTEQTLSQSQAASSTESSENTPPLSGPSLASMGSKPMNAENNISVSGGEVKESESSVKTIVAAEKNVSWNPELQGSAGRTTYVYGEDPRVQNYVKQKSSQMKWLGLGFIAIVAAIAFALWAWEVKKQKDLLASKYQKLEQARELFSQFKFHEALKIYEPIYQSDKSLFKLSDRLNLAALLVGAERRLASAEGILAEIERPTQMSEWKTWLRIKYVLASDKKQWEEAIFILNELLQEQFDPSLVLDLIQVHILADDKIKARELLLTHWNQLLQKRADRDKATIRSLVLLSDTLEDPNQELRNKTFQLMRDNLGNFSQVYIPMVTLWGNFLLNSGEPLDPIVESILGINVFDWNQFELELLDRDYLVTDERILPMCEVLTAQMPQRNPRKEQQVLWEDVSTILKSLCLAFFSESTWSSLLKEARRARPQSQLLAAADANLMLWDGRVAEAVAVVDLCQNIPWCYLAKARICLVKKSSCVEEFGSTLKATARSWGPFYYLFTAYLEQLKGNEFARRNAIKNGRKEYPLYRPLIDLEKL